MDAFVFSSHVGNYDRDAILSQNQFLRIELNVLDNSGGRCSDMYLNEF